MKRLRAFLRGAWLRLYKLVVPPYETLVIEEALPKQLKRRRENSQSL
jgi:hypothetical protein